MKPQRYPDLSPFDSSIKQHHLRNHQSNENIPRSLNDASLTTGNETTKNINRSYVKEANLIKHSLAVSSDVDKIIERCNKIYEGTDKAPKRQRPGTAKPLNNRDIIYEDANESYRNIKAKILNDDMSLYSGINNKSTKSTNNFAFKAYKPKFSKFTLKRKSVNQTAPKSIISGVGYQSSVKKRLINRGSTRGEYSVSGLNHFMVI